MAPTAHDRRGSFLERIGALLAPFPGRLEFAARLALICAITTLVVEIYQTPEPALTAYVTFFVMKPDRAASVVTSIVMLLLISLIVGLVLALTMQVIEQSLWRVTAMTLVSFCLTFAASASKLKPVAGTVALITAYALDLLGSVPGGELATRGILYVWLFVGIPAGVSSWSTSFSGRRRDASPSEHWRNGFTSPARCFVRLKRTRGRHSRNACTKASAKFRNG